jgi:hypothetical protein
MYAEPKLGSPANIFWIALATIGVLAWCFGPQTWDWYQAKKMGESQPCLRLGVQPLVIADADVASGTKEAFFGYEFEVPWPSVDAKVIRQIATVTTGNGPGLVFWNPADRRQLFDSTRKWTHPNTRDALGSILGKDAARSNYDLIEQILDTTPEQISPIMSKREANGRLTLLRMKSALYCDKGRPAFYSYQRSGLNCLQAGEFGVGRGVEVKCFDGMDRELNFHFSAGQDARTVFTQAEINRVVQTLRPVEKPTILSSEPGTRNTN